MILDQADRDVAVDRLLSKVSEVFDFMTTEEALARVPSMLAIYGKIARQSQECADFITHYSTIKNACELNSPRSSLRLNVISSCREKTWKECL